jgi:hypothetical protein
MSKLLILLTTFASLYSTAFAAAVVGTNIGGWLVLEPWITPSLVGYFSVLRLYSLNFSLLHFSALLFSLALLRVTALRCVDLSCAALHGVTLRCVGLRCFQLPALTLHCVGLV